MAPTPAAITKQLIRKNKNGKIIFHDTGHPEQYFLVEVDGDLSVYDKYGFVETYKKLKLKTSS